MVCCLVFVCLMFYNNIYGISPGNFCGGTIGDAFYQGNCWNLIIGKGGLHNTRKNRWKPLTLRFSFQGWEKQSLHEPPLLNKTHPKIFSTKRGEWHTLDSLLWTPMTGTVGYYRWIKVGYFSCYFSHWKILIYLVMLDTRQTRRLRKCQDSNE